VARARRVIAGHKLGTAIAVLLVAAAVVGVATGSLSGKPASSGTSATSVVYSHPVAAPAFTLPALAAASAAAGPVSLAQYQGRPLIVNFFASWCKPCQQETPLLARYYKAHSVTIIGVDGNDTTANATAFVKAKGVTYAVGVDPQLATASAYNVNAFPQTFFLNARHQIVYQVFGAVTQADLAQGTALMGQDRG
jgi:cytochrome c biogenesis protein CcmG/thiol:disulfide interchange protein DsbE